MNRLNLEVVVLQIPKTTTSNVLPSVEKALQKLNDALVSLETSELDHAETLGCADYLRWEVAEQFISRMLLP